MNTQRIDHSKEENNIQKIWQAMDRDVDSLLSIMESLIAFPTVSPPARNTADVQHWISTFLEEQGFTTEQFPFYEKDVLLVGERTGSQAELFNSLIVNGHIDVAAIGDKNQWETDPFTLTQKENRLFARGTSDMKGAMAANLWIFKLLNQLDIDLKGTLQFQSAVGEEAGEAGTRTLLEKGYTADYAIVNDTTDLALQGQGGCVTGWITVKSPEVYHDGNRRKMIHAGGGIFAASAVEKMVPIIEGLQKLERHWAVTKQYPGFPAGTTTINPSYIQGGINPAFIANECHLWITVHFYPNESIEEVQKEIDEHVAAIAASDPWLKQHPPVIRWGGRSMIEEQGEIFPALEINDQHPAFNLLKDSHQQIANQEPIVRMSTSVNDSGWFAYFGIPTISYGPGELAEAHSNNESVSVEDILLFAKTMAAFIIQWCNLQKAE